MKQLKHVKSEIRWLIVDVCQQLTGHSHDNEVCLMLGTAAAESGLVFRKQFNDGPARGLWQMEPATGRDVFIHFLAFKHELRARLVEMWFEIHSSIQSIPYIEDIEHHLECYDDFACAMARIHYLRDPDPIPDTLQGQAEYWKRVYNTPTGAGTVEHYLSMWDQCRCEEVLN